MNVKGIVHPKMKIISSFTRPQVFPNLYECVCSAEHKGRYSEECGKQSGSGALLTFFSYYGSQWCPKTDWLPSFFKIYSFVFGRTNTFIQAWKYLRVSKWWQNFHFEVNHPFIEILNTWHFRHDFTHVCHWPLLQCFLNLHARTYTHICACLFLWIVRTFHRLLLLLYWPNNIFYPLT